MTIAIGASEGTASAQDCLSGTARAHAIDRWIFVFTAASLIAIVFTGFIPDSFMKVAAIGAGQRPPFPPILHVHAALMGSFLLLLLAQSVLMATGRRNGHMQLGIAGMVLAPAVVISGFILVPTMYHMTWGAAHFGPAPVRQQLQPILPFIDNILLLQFRAGLLFAVCMGIALRSRVREGGVHKRLVFLAIATALPAAFDRMLWLPTTMPSSPLGADLYSILAFAPMFIWDLIRNRRVHRAYWIWAALFVPTTALAYALWDKPWWHAAAHRIMGV
jgi:hypothetical protein